LKLDERKEATNFVAIGKRASECLTTSVVDILGFFGKEDDQTMQNGTAVWTLSQQGPTEKILERQIGTETLCDYSPLVHQVRELSFPLHIDLWKTGWTML
jgi:hypothetical protein